MKQSTHFGFQQVPFDEKQKKVNGVFDSVANQYDLMNDLLSCGVHRLWKRTAIAKAQLREGLCVLDLAGGTGDMAALIAPKIGPSGQLVLADINHAMLSLGRNRLLDKGLFKNLHFIQADGQVLPFGTNCFDRITLAFGIRNFPDKSKALVSLYRVLKPGGLLVILEFTTPTLPGFTQIYDLYSFKVLPFVGQLVTQDAASYQYLAESIRMHPNPQAFQDLILAAGFDQCHFQTLSLGIVAIHYAYKY
jgi:demethylmenaquinone methyltransferase/2-methoxy-6-polyprenyl-1,4-benzoquinol methylase